MSWIKPYICVIRAEISLKCGSTKYSDRVKSKVRPRSHSDIAHGNKDNDKLTTTRLKGYIEVTP